MRRKDVLKLDDVSLDKKVKIQGTQFDRKRKLNDKDWKKVRSLLKRGYSYNYISEVFGVKAKTIRYGVDEEFRKYCIQHMTGKHSGVDTCTFENRVSYKRNLIKRRKIKVKNI